MNILTENNYKEFKTEDEVLEWENSNYQECIKSINKTRLKDLKTTENVLNTRENVLNTRELGVLLDIYTGGTSDKYNSLLRNIKGDLDRLEKTKSNDSMVEGGKILSLIEHLNKYETPENLVVYRYTKLRYIWKFWKVQIEYGFMSTTFYPYSDDILRLVKENGYTCLMKIYLPKGTKGVPVMLDEDKLKEYEFLIPPNTKYKIRSMEISENSEIIFLCDLIE